jgi:lipoate-protein ligase A
MEFFDVTLPSLPENLALDEALLLAAESGEGGEALRLWEWPRPAVVLGAGGRIADDVDVEACDRDVVALARRSSGGGTVLLGPGCLLYTVILRYDRAIDLRDIRKSYQWILARITNALPGAAVAGPSDLAIGDRKIGGSAQQRKREHLLHHGTLLYDFELASIGRYLKEPARQPDYRGRRSHDEFLTNVPITAAELRSRLVAAWEATTLERAVPGTEIARLVGEKFGRPEWVSRL